MRVTGGPPHIIEVTMQYSYSGNYDAFQGMDSFDVRDFASIGPTRSPGAFSGGPGTGMMVGAIGQTITGVMAAMNQSKLAKMQYRLSGLQHKFYLEQNKFQNGMVGLQRQAVGIQAEQAKMAGRSAMVEAKLQEALARINARLAESAAQGTLRSGARQEQAKRLETAAFKSRQRAGYAASGIDLTSESAVAQLTSTDIIGEIDANTISANAIRAAWGYRTEGVNSQIAGMMAGANGRMAAANANANSAAIASRMPSYVTPDLTRAPQKPSGSLLGVSGALLSGATQVAATYYSLRREGAFN